MKLSVRPAGALLVIAGLSACDVPTGVPRWETTWMTPGEGTTVSVAELLPASVQLTPDSSAFVVGFDPVSASWQLSEICGTCPPVTAVAPKPAFTASVSTTMPLPADVNALVVSGGDLTVELTNGFDFDPLRPGTASDSGTITIAITSGAQTVGSLVIDGRQQAFPSGTTLTETLAFQPSTIAGDLEVTFTIDSPAGDNATLDPSDEFSAQMSSSGVLVSEATVAATSTSIAGSPVELDLADVQDLADRITAGTIFLEIRNPFALGGDLVLSVDPGVDEFGNDPPPIEKPVTLAPGDTESSVTFTESEIQQIIGTTSALSVSGVVSAAGGEVTVRPDMVIAVETRLRVTVEAGGDSEDDSGF